MIGMVYHCRTIGSGEKTKILILLGTYIPYIPRMHPRSASFLLVFPNKKQDIYSPWIPELPRGTGHSSATGGLWIIPSKAFGAKRTNSGLLKIVDPPIIHCSGIFSIHQQKLCWGSMTGSSPFCRNNLLPFSHIKSQDSPVDAGGWKSLKFHLDVGPSIGVEY